MKNVYFTPNYTPRAQVIAALAPKVMDCCVPGWDKCKSCDNREVVKCFVCHRLSYNDILKYAVEYPYEAAETLADATGNNCSEYLRVEVNGETVFSPERLKEANQLLTKLGRQLEQSYTTIGTPVKLHMAIRDILVTGKCEHFSDGTWARYGLIKARKLAYNFYDLDYWYHFGAVPHSKVGCCKPAPVMVDFAFGDESNFARKKAEFNPSDYNKMMGLEFDN